MAIVADSLPPTAPTAYVSPAPSKNLFLKSGVPLFPSHIAYPVGIAFVAPDQRRIQPVGTPPPKPVRFAPLIAGKAPVRFAAGKLVKLAPLPLNVVAEQVPDKVNPPLFSCILAS